MALGLGVDAEAGGQGSFAIVHPWLERKSTSNPVAPEIPRAFGTVSELAVLLEPLEPLNQTICFHRAQWPRLAQQDQLAG